MKFTPFIVLIYLITLNNISLAQNVGINTTGVAPHGSSILDITSTDKGILIPRVNIIDLTTAAPITTPANSLLVYNTNITSGIGFYFWNGTRWINLTDNSGNADEDWHEVGTTNHPNHINDDIFTNGNVGIGITSPLGALHTVHNTNIPRLDRVAGDGTTTTTERAIVRFYREGEPALTISGHPTHGIITVNTGDTLSLEEGAQKRMTIINGNVGIGTLGPTELLHVSGKTGPATIKIEADTDNTTESDQAYILLEQDGGTVQAHLGFGSTEATGDLFRIGVKGPIDPTIDYSAFVVNGQNSRVGINTSNPTNPLSVFGSASKTGGGAWGTFSDRRLKKNITNYNEGIDLISKVKLHNFQYNKQYENIFGAGKSLNNKVYQGVIAQELLTIAPDMVTEKKVEYTDDNGNSKKKTFYEVNTSKFTFALINATKEQQALIEQQNIIIKDLQQRIKAIEESLKK